MQIDYVNLSISNVIAATLRHNAIYVKAAPLIYMSEAVASTNTPRRQNFHLQPALALDFVVELLEMLFRHSLVDLKVMHLCFLLKGICKPDLSESCLLFFHVKDCLGLIHLH